MITNSISQISKYIKFFKIIVYGCLILGKVYSFCFKVKCIPYEIFGTCIFNLNFFPFCFGSFLNWECN